MLEEKEFIEKVWTDYEKYVSGEEKKDKFYNKHVYKNTESQVLLRSVAMFLMAFTITATLVGGVYAGIKTYTDNKKIEQQEAKAKEESYSYYQKNHIKNNYETNTTIYQYHKIKTYKEYLEARKSVSSLIEMTETDFENNFMVIIGTFGAMNLREQGVYIKDVSVDDTTLTILLDIDKNKENLDLSVRLPLDMDREYIDLLFNNRKPEMEGYKYVDEIIADYKNYTAEQAEIDNCIVEIDHYGNTDKFEEFMEKTRKGENSCVRIINYMNDQKINILCDIEYKNGEYIIEKVYFPEFNENVSRTYYLGDSIESETRENNKIGRCTTEYFLRDKKREEVLLERYNKLVKEEYNKEKNRYLENEDYKLEFYKDKEELKGNVYDESKRDYYEELYREEYLKAVENRIELDFKGPYENIVGSQIKKRESIFFIRKQLIATSIEKSP